MSGSQRNYRCVSSSTYCPAPLSTCSWNCSELRSSRNFGGVDARGDAPCGECGSFSYYTLSH
eukprot:4287229-Pyramimonas_sp.AAC.3